MFIRSHLVVLILVASFVAASLFQVPALAQSGATGTVRGVVTLEDTGKPVHGVADKNFQSLGEALDHELGIAKRSFGPATSRPVLRGFDGDRVLVLEDGNRIGSLGFQSGDHTEPMDVMNLEKLEIVRGPATLLYGANAIGGIVNGITGHESAHPGTHGYVTGVAGTNNYQAGGSGGVEYGTEKWLVWGNGGGQRAGDYDTPIGRITNSYSRAGNGSGG